MTDTVNAGLLRSLIERIERVEEDIRDRNSDKSEIYKEARGHGYDVKAIRRCVATRKLDTNEREERDAIFDLYWSALHGGSRVHVYEEQPETAKETQETPAPERKTAGHAPREMGSNGANVENGDVDGSTARAGHTGQKGYVGTGPVENRNSEENFVERNTSGPDAKRAPDSQSAVYPLNADLPEAAPNPQQASGTLSRDPRDVTYTEYSDGFDPSKLWLNKSGRAA
ncbi:DUF2312 domain-containing protein [Mesorhizobium sp. Pch-S]|uniref:DUF2312 domain-containing protein n=1 Tax=Mesorhizobium sp. Pch-S TaxID=2082387 RepID=UPI00101376E0|nr:hypothetical protein C1M53_31530 [Mesorhizobium sp. Pch-S]